MVPSRPGDAMHPRAVGLPSLPGMACSTHTQGWVKAHHGEGKHQACASRDNPHEEAALVVWGPQPSLWTR